MKSVQIISVFRTNTGKYGPEETPYLDTFHAVINVHIEMDSESYQTSKMELFVIKAHSFKPLTIYAKVSILGLWQDPKYVSLNNQGSCNT